MRPDSFRAGSTSTRLSAAREWDHITGDDELLADAVAFYRTTYAI